MMTAPLPVVPSGTIASRAAWSIKSRTAGRIAAIEPLWCQILLELLGKLGRSYFAAMGTQFIFRFVSIRDGWPERSHP